MRPDGTRAFGLVERVDTTTGQAVVRVGGVIPVADAPPTSAEEAP
jgi:hypothetical protein